MNQARADVVEGVARVDGRLGRGARAHAAVVDALLALVDAGDLRPTAPRIAERAGVSLRSVFHHFPDLETLFSAAADRQATRLRAMARALPTGGPLGTRIAAFVAQRARLLEAIGPVRRAALLLEPFSPAVAARLRRSRALGRAEVERAFGHELRRRRADDRRDLASTLAAVASWPTWEALRTHERLSVTRASRALARTIRLLLEGDRRP